MENNSCIIYTDFLRPDENTAIYAHALQNAALFSHTMVGDGENEGIVNDYWRHSLSLQAVYFKEISKILVEKIETSYPEIIEKLQIPVFEISHFEIQLTSHNHGEFFKPHIDNGKSFKNRVITFVYYFHSFPKMFTGGQLLFLNNKPKPLIVEPENNTIVFFNSSVKHAVHPVSCPSKQFEHGRFTLNGWIRKKEETDNVKD